MGNYNVTHKVYGGDGMRSWLRDKRLKLCMTEKKVADLVGIAQPFYHCIETGEKNPSVSTAQKIADVLNFKWTEFFENAGNGKAV